jgi:centrosomal CEP192-like protein/ASPM-SPD-2-Hydin domain-containing protein/HYDIN/CFA65/VesB family protein/beta-propeller repeat-containing protein
LLPFLRRLGQIALFSCIAVHAAGQNPTYRETSNSRGELKMRLAQLPLAFEQNVGQAVAGADFLVRSGAMQAEISAARIRVSLPPAQGRQQQLAIQLDGAREDAEPNPADRLQGDSNYLIGKDATAWRQHVTQYGRVRYLEIYRGIDLTYYGNGTRIEHDFVVHAGADPSQIHLSLDGARNVQVGDNGDLRIALESDAITLHRPRAYQTIAGVQRDVPASFVVKGHHVRLSLGAYDRSRELIIDPVLDYSTYLGNASIYVTGVAVDAAGDTYIAGGAPIAYPATANAVTCSSCVTPANKLAVFVTKLNPTATAVLYSTFIGGSVDPNSNPSNDQSNALTVDANGDAIATGTTSSADFPLKNPISAGTPTTEDGFLVSLTPDGSGLNFSSRLGGSSSSSTSALVYPESLATDSNGNVYAAGLSQSAYLPVTPGALNAFTPTYSNNGAFLLKLSSNGALIYGAVVGGTGQASGSTGPTGLAVDSDGVVYMAGTVGNTVFTNTTPWPTTPGAYQTALISPADNAPFLTRISSDGSTILSSTLVGSGSVTAMALTPSHDVLITGQAGYNFPVTADAYQSNTSTSVNGVISLGALGFFAKVSQDGTQLLYSSAFGPSSLNLSINGIKEDPSGNVWLAGTTTGALPTLVHPLQSVFGGFGVGGEGFIAQFDPPMHNLLFSSYIDGVTGASQVKGLAIDSNGLAHIAGVATQSFPTSPGVIVPTVQPPPPNYFYTYGYAALIDASKAGGSICFANVRGATAQLGTSATGSFDIVNCGDGPLTISSAQLTSSVFAFASANTCTGTLAAGSSCTLNYTFTPTATGTVTAVITIASDAPMAANAATISGMGTAPVVSLQQTNLTFPPMLLGTKAPTPSVVVQNKGTAPLIVNMAQTNATSPFSLAGPTCSSPVIPSGSCLIGVTFNPTAAGSATGTLTIYTNDPKTPSVTVSLSGSAVASYPVPTITALSSPTLSLDGTTVNLNIAGTNIFPATTVQINGIAYPPVSGASSGGLVVKVDPATIAAFGEFPVQVFNPSPGGGASNIATLTTYHVLNLTTTDMIYEPHSGLLYLAVPAASTSNANTILPFNPATETFGTPIPVQPNPTKLAVSDDGQYLYVASYPSIVNSVERINLTTSAVDRTFALPGSSTGITDMHVVPGSPQLLVASLSVAASPFENGVALFNDSGVVQYISTNGSAGYSLDSFAFTSDPTTFYGYPVGASFFSVANVSASGITRVSQGGFTCCDQASGSFMASDGALLYTNSGEVWDPKTRTLLGTYPGNLFYEQGIVADPTAKRTFMLQSSFLLSPGNSEGNPTVASYDPSNFTLAGHLNFGLLSNSPTNLVRWGVDGFAFFDGAIYSTGNTPYSSSQLVLFRSSLATPGVTNPVTLSPASLNFGLQPVGFASAGQTITVSNSGSATLTGLSVSITGTNAGYFATTSGGCGTSLTPGSSCTVTVVFTPGATGSAQAMLQIIDSAVDSPQNVPLTGSAAAPSFTLSSQSLNFNSLPVGTSNQQTVTVTNSGTVPLAGIASAAGGTNAADYTATSNCAAAIAPGAACTMTVAFRPSTAGNESATLTVSASGASSQAIALSGTATAPDFVLPPPTGSSSNTVPAGQPASFGLNVSESGTFSGTITMSCSNLPAYAACNFTPSSFTLGSTPTVVTLSISTQQTLQAELRPQEERGRPLHPIQWAMLLLVLPAGSRRLRGQLGSGKLLMLVLLLSTGAFAFSGCAGGSGGQGGGSTGPTIKKTPSGSYTISVTATSGIVAHTTNVTLIVQ